MPSRSKTSVKKCGSLLPSKPGSQAMETILIILYDKTGMQERERNMNMRVNQMGGWQADSTVIKSAMTDEKQRRFAATAERGMMMKKRLGLVIALLALLIASAAMAEECEREEDHRFGSWWVKTTATCTRQGHEFRDCRLCDHWEQRRTAKLPHTPGEMTVTKAATCTETGRQEAVCQVCENLVRYTIDKLEHNYGEMTVKKEPDCTQKGTGEYTCIDCGMAKRESIESLGHDWGKTTVTKEPTCTKTGVSEEACLRCGRVRKTTLDKIAHSFDEWMVTREPQGKRKGLRVSACTVCERACEEYFYPEGTLYEGMEPSEEVIRLQEMLRDLGFYKGSIRSGQFGDLTTSAVVRFQESIDLEGTGLADAQTIGALRIAWEKATGKTDAGTLEPAEMAAAEQAQPIAE